MKKNISNILSWVFIGICLLLSIGMGFGVGSFLMLVAAVLALPLQPIHALWDKVLPVQKEETPKKWWQRKDKKAQKKVADNRSLKPLIIAMVFIIAFSFGAASMESDSTHLADIPVSSQSSLADNGSIQEPADEPLETKPSTNNKLESTTPTPEFNSETLATPGTENTSSTPSVPSSVVETQFDISNVPAFSGKPYFAVNNNTPYFSSSDYTTTSFEQYSELDRLGRCGVAFACVGQDLMPTEARGSIGSVKPTGWQTVKYDSVDGKYLYNRCHLIGFQLSGENANTRNLITGTRYMNVDGMLPFENMVADYVKETGNHVMYRVNPIFEGNNLLATGVLMEAHSVEDGGEGISFNVFCYNNQPDISIDYANGLSSLISGSQPIETAPPITQKPQAEEPPSQSGEVTYILNTNTHKFHYPSCSSADSISAGNRQETTASRDELIAQGYDPCGRCHP